jgi:hypothetical protein
MPMLQGEALVVHLFVAAAGPDRDSDHQYLQQVWDRCRERFGLTGQIAGLPTQPQPVAAQGVLAGLRRPDTGVPFVEEALLRREHDTFCLSVMREPAGADWSSLQRDWLEATYDLALPPGLLGSAHLFLARRRRPVRPARPPDPAALDRAVRAALPPPGEQDPPAQWSSGVTVEPGFAVWEASAVGDERQLRRIVVVAPEHADRLLSGWAWVVGEGRELPAFGRYLMNAATLRQQLRVRADQSGFRQVGDKADAAVDRLLALLVPRGADREPTVDELLAARKEIAALQAGELGLVRTATRLVEMRRTVEIATANLVALADRDAGGLFADDRGLGTWFTQQLDDDAVYVAAGRERVGQVAALADQLLQRRAQLHRERLQVRQERFGLGLTGAVGAILMVLTAIQSLGYEPPLPAPARPAVAAALGAVALLTTALVLRIASRGRWWSQVLLSVAIGLLCATGTWVAVALTTAATWRWPLAGFAVGAVLTGTVSALVTRRRTSPAGEEAPR